MAIEHASIADAQLHEPKGAAGAAVNTVYTANGAGSGAWALPIVNADAQYGGIHSTESDSVTIATIGTTAKVFAGFSANAPSNGITPDYTNDKLTITVAGDYMVAMYVSFATVASGDAGNYRFHVRVNSVESVIGFHRDESGTTDDGVGACNGILTCAISDVITVWVESDSGGDTDDITVDSCGLSVHLLKAS